MKLRAYVFAALAAQAVAGMAQAATYDCTFADVQSDGGWISGQYVIAHDAAAGTAVVDDGLVRELTGGPVAAKSVEESGGKIVFVWEVLASDVSGETTRMLYRAAWFKGPGYMRITATPQGYDNMFEAEGSCRIG